MTANQGLERGSLICGKSTHNQCIRRLWRDVYNCVTGIYHELTTLWRMKKFLIPPMGLIWEHFVTCFELFINDKFDAWRQAWSKHRMRTIKTSPICLWVSCQMISTPDGDQGPEQLMHYGVERVVGGDDRETADNDGPIYWRNPYRQRPVCITKRSVVLVTPRKFRNKKLHQS